MRGWFPFSLSIPLSFLSFLKENNPVKNQRKKKQPKKNPTLIWDLLKNILCRKTYLWTLEALEVGIWIHSSRKCVATLGILYLCSENCLFKQERLKLFIKKNAKHSVETAKSMCVVGITGTSSSLPPIGCGTQDKALWKCAQLEDGFFPN